MNPSVDRIELLLGQDDDNVTLVAPAPLRAVGTRADDPNTLAG